MSKQKRNKVVRNKKAMGSAFLKKHWPVLLVAFGGLTLVFAVSLVLAKNDVDPNFVPHVRGAPSLLTDKEQVDLGDIPVNRMVRVEFTLMNVGDKSLFFAQAPYVELAAGC